MILDEILFNLKQRSNENACMHDRQYSYKEFYEIVCKTYALIKDAPKDKPIVVYGHKEVYMIASFLACSFLGIAYVPIDKMMNDERINYIIHDTKPSFVLGNLDKKGDFTSVSFERIENNNCFEDITTIDLKPDDTYYILYTSGTTGVPKGVMVTYDNLDSCIHWLKEVTNLSDNLQNYTIYNQAVFSFDLSVADIYLSLVTGSNHYCGSDISILNMSEKYDELKFSQTNMMILTPSVASLFCTDLVFNENLLPSLEQILFCGEVLEKKLVTELYKRFPNIKIINMYGPTECTFAVTSIEVPNENLEEVSIGFPKKDVDIYIVEDLKEKSEGEVGEILITGKSVAKGYLNLNDNNKFITYKGKRGYLTGDLGYYKNNELYYVSRKDTQVKYKGYRIELLDIESNIAQIEGVELVKVKAKIDNNIVKRIVALIVLKDETNEDLIRTAIKEKLPEYMIPQLRFVKEIPLTINGKLDV